MGKSFNTGTLVNGLSTDANGNVGIGTSSPNANLEVSVSNTIGSFARFRLNSPYYNNWDILNDSGLAFIRGTSEYMRITSVGSVGIGTSTPNDLLEVRGGFIRLSATAGNGPQLNIYSNGQTSGNVTLAQGFALATDNIGYLYNRANAAFVFGTNNSEKMRILANGNVGIGTTSPGQKLVVYGGNGDQLTLDNAGNRYTQLNFFNNGNQRAYLATDNTASQFQLIAQTGYSMIFGTDGGERMRITSTGTVVAGATGNTPTGTDNSAYLWVASQNRMYINAVGGGCATFGRASTTGNIMGFDYNGGGVGNISTNGSTITFSGTAVSDARYKENIQPITDALDAINQVDFVTFKYKESGYDSAGVTSQQIQTIEKLSLFVIDGIDEESYKAFDYNALVGYLGKAIQELKAEIDILKNK
jgi:hypothetical protein